MRVSCEIGMSVWQLLQAKRRGFCSASQLGQRNAFRCMSRLQLLQTTDRDAKRLGMPNNFPLAIGELENLS